MKTSANNAPLIYNLFPRLAGEFTQWVSHFERAREMGFNWIFINPIQLSGMSGSMYSIKDYYQIDPRYLGSGKETPESQVREIIRLAHGLDLRIMIDLVINHTAIDSVLVKQKPDWYKRDEKGKILNPKAMDGDRVVAVWGDLAEIDNENSPEREALWKYWEDYAAYLLDLGFDGFRCDAAYQVPTGLWHQLIGKAKSQNSEITFFAESLGCPFEDVLALGQAGFDYTFNSSKYWDFEEPWALDQYEQNRTQAAPTISFAESHDTQRLAADLDGNWPAVKMRYLFSVLFSTGVMMPVGLEFGFRKPLHVVQTTPDDWEETAVDLRDFIRKTNRLKLETEVFARESKLEVVYQENEEVFCFRKTIADGSQTALVVLNKDLTGPRKFILPELKIWLNSPRKITNISPEKRSIKFSDTIRLTLKPAEVIVILGQN